MNIRGATAGDLAAVASCADLAFGAPRSPDNRVELALQIQQGLVQVMSDAARVLGYISFSPNRDHLYVEAIAVLPELQGQGLGSRLLGFAEQAARRLGLRSVRLFTSGEIAGNLIFYRRRGYHETGRCREANFSRVFYSKHIAPRRHDRPTHQPVRRLALVDG
jgi:ribosomal protein S18 acetylase RimI-like enzyme